MESLIHYQQQILDRVGDQFFRSLYHRLPWQERFIAIKGLRGAGKTTMMLQYLKYELATSPTALFVTADSPWFYNHSLLDLAEDFVKMGGKVLFIDEVHKYANWSRELKNIYDIFGGLQVVFSASSALEIYRGEADLSRRVLTYELAGLSFREYLELMHQLSFPVYTLADILKDHRAIAHEVAGKIKPLPLFKDYLRSGYLPIAHHSSEEIYLPRLYNILNTVLEYDISFIEGYTATNVVKMKQLLGIIAEAVPFEPNISRLAQKMTVGRDTVNNYLLHLQKGRILNLIRKQSKGVGALQKPDKIYLENPNLHYAMNSNPEIGTIRESFLLNQLVNLGLEVTLPPKGDFYLPSQGLTVEVGGKNKTATQVKDVPNAIIAADDIEYGFQQKIPLWLFGFMY